MEFLLFRGKNKQILLFIYYSYLEPVISSQKAAHERVDMSLKHEATIAKNGQRIILAFLSSASPGNFCFSHCVTTIKSSAGVLLSSLAERHPSSSDFFGADFMLRRTVSTWALSLASFNSLVA